MLLFIFCDLVRFQSFAETGQGPSWQKRVFVVFNLKPQCLCINFHGFVPMKRYYKHKAKILVTTYTRHLDTCLSHLFQRAILFTMGLRCVRTVAPASCWVYVRHARTCPLGHRADVATLYLWPRFLLLGSSKRFPAKGCQVTSHMGQHGPQQHLSSWDTWENLQET